MTTYSGNDPETGCALMFVAGAIAFGIVVAVLSTLVVIGVIR